MALLSLRLLIALIVAQSLCVLLFTHSPSSRDVTAQMLQQFHCVKLRQQFSNFTSTDRVVLSNFSKELSDFLSCPSKLNETYRELQRTRLQFCCNATGSVILTKRNTDVNQEIPYDTNEKRTYKIKPELHSMLPEDSPWLPGSLSRCAVVGSGGILKNSSCGREIDSADFVIRFNLALINDSDVGQKTDLVTVNPSQIRKDLEQNPDPLLERVGVYGNAPLVIPAFAYSFCTLPALRVLRVLYPIRAKKPVFFFSPYYLRSLDRFWKGRGLKEIRLSTGFMLISMALEMCEDVHVYGFWPFATNLEGNPVPYHYYDAGTVNRVMHKMPQEFVRLLQLHSQGALTLHLQPCAQ
ncbi:hypothetical protein DNTS_027663 [Danionella cerebrum]|uniref:Uncharacterized protein n=1 Tax=Danionella cerebrum TaxID=2873325 RepID=A0A553NH78_9TELE|nr:hypothetical protein DNTS_027663 [Danionella translucida]